MRRLLWQREYREETAAAGVSAATEGVGDALIHAQQAEAKENNRGNNMSDDQLTRIEEKLDGIFKILNGNGQIGLCAKCSILWKSSLFIVAGVVLALMRSFFQ